MQYHFGVNCIGYLFMLQNIFSHIKKILIDTHTEIGTEITDIIVFRKKLLKFLQGEKTPKHHQVCVNFQLNQVTSHIGSHHGWQALPKISKITAMALPFNIEACNKHHIWPSFG